MMEDEQAPPAWQIPPYGEREPLSHDIEAIVAYVKTMAGLLGDRKEMAKVIDRAQAVFEVYVEQFRQPENG